MLTDVLIDVEISIGSNSDPEADRSRARSSPNNRHEATAAACPFGANRRPCPKFDAHSMRGSSRSRPIWINDR